MKKRAHTWFTLAFGVAGALASVQPADAQSVEDLRHMSIGDLADIDVSSVTKSTQSLSDAAASLYVITHDDIVRSGATTLPEILRLAPNVDVARTSPAGYTITTRGMNGNSAAQNYSNKLLVLIDGRTVYSPLFSGVYWDMQDVVPADIDRVEVISGPGATLWGANAVNGVINIVTRNGALTQGLLASASGGAAERSGALRYGAQLGDNLSLRLYATANQADTYQLPSGVSADDGWHRLQGGFHLGWQPSPAETMSLQGDIYGGKEHQLSIGDQHIRGGNLLARWNRNWSDGSTLQLQAYYDHAHRGTENSGTFAIDTWDFEAQHSFALGSAHKIVWGAGLRLSPYTIHSTPALDFAQLDRTLKLADIFAQDSMLLAPGTTLVLGLKVERDPYSGVVLLPSGRISQKLGSSAMLWAAVSRAIRSPTPFDSDVIERLGNMVFVTGSSTFLPEKLTAYETGLRWQPGEHLSLSVSGFYNRYDDLRSIEPTPRILLPLHWGNGLKAETYGVDLWADYGLISWWRLSAGASFLFQNRAFKAGSGAVLGLDTAQIGDDPKTRLRLTSSMNLGPAVTFDMNLRYISRRPSPVIAAYAEVDGRIGWNLTDRLQFSLTAANLLHKSHVEAPGGDAIPRRIEAGIAWRL